MKLNLAWKVSLPIRVKMGKKYFPLNLNHYRNAHYQTLNKAKVLFAELVEPLLSGIPHLEKCSFRYVYYAPSKRDVDVSNICSVVDKFFSDVFVSAGKLIDDNYNYLSEVSYAFGGIDPINPRVDVIITPQGNQYMKIVITQSDFQQALVAHISQFGIDVDPSQISLDVDEIEIELNPLGQDTEAPEKQTTETKKRTRRTPAEIAADKAAKEAEDAAKASAALDTDKASTRTVDTTDVTQDLVDETPTTTDDPSETSSILDEISEPETLSTPAVGGSIFD